MFLPPWNSNDSGPIRARHDHLARHAGLEKCRISRPYQEPRRPFRVGITAPPPNVSFSWRVYSKFSLSGKATFSGKGRSAFSQERASLPPPQSSLLGGTTATDANLSTETLKAWKSVEEAATCTCPAATQNRGGWPHRPLRS